MWFLQTDILLRFIGACILFALVAYALGKSNNQQRLSPLLVLLDILIIAYVSPGLAVFYSIYTLATYCFILIMARVKKGRKGIFVALCLLCTAPFFYMKLCGAFSQLPLLVVLVGISYNMLKAIDGLYYVYYAQEKIPFILYANYIMFFPVITAGPIYRYRDFRNTYLSPTPITAVNSVNCFKRFIRGMFKKLVAAAVVLIVVQQLLTWESHWYLSCLIAALSYLMLWLDMSGYADIAISLGGFMGFKVPENFKHPLKAPSFTQFWRNWHISLSDWIREHIFVVFNGKRLTKVQGAIIGFFTMMFMALWHEISLVFLVDGLICGLVLAVENLFGLTTVSRKKSRPYFVFRCVVTNFIFAVTTLFFTLEPQDFLTVFRGFLTL